MKPELKPIGIIHSPYKTLEEIPIQASRSNKSGKIEVFEGYESGLKDIEGFSHIIILYILHKSDGYELHVKPHLDTEVRGLFATRSPRRPNPIGLSVVKLIERNGNILRVEGIDALNETPLLDIKPYIPEFDNEKSIRIGWLEDKINAEECPTGDSIHRINSGRLRCSNRDINEVDCPCLKIECIHHGVCCECIRYHIKNGGTPACLK